MRLLLATTLLVTALSLVGCHPLTSGDASNSHVQAPPQLGNVTQNTQMPPQAMRHLEMSQSARKALREGRYAEAETLIKQIPAAERGGAGNKTLGNALKAQGKWREAIAAYRAFEAHGEIVSDHATYLKAHAECAERLGDEAEAEYVYGLLAEYISKSPGKSTESVGLGDLKGADSGKAMALAIEALTLTGRGEFRSAVDEYRGR